MENLKWRIAAASKGIDIQDAYTEIERIKTENNGEITARLILDASRDRNATLHKYFNWNDADAAEKYRLRQARELLQNITVNIVSDGQPRTIRVYEVVKLNDGNGVFKDIESLSVDDVEYIRLQSIKGLTQYKNKLSVYDAFGEIVKHLDEAIVGLETLEPTTAL